MIKVENKARWGFTLLELLVVIGIIALLISIAAVAYSSAQGKTRDARRKSDIKGIQAAMEQAYSASATSVYPVCSGNPTGCAISSYFSNSSIPVDPGANVYSITATTTTYCVCAHLEAATGGNSTNTSCAAGSGAYFCLTQLQ